MPKCCDITTKRTPCYKTAALGSTRCKKHTDFFHQAGPPVAGKCAMYIYSTSPYANQLAKRCEKGAEDDGYCAYHQPVPESCQHNHQFPRFCYECRLLTQNRQAELDAKAVF